MSTHYEALHEGQGESSGSGSQKKALAKKRADVSKTMKSLKDKHDTWSRLVEVYAGTFPWEEHIRGYEHSVVPNIAFSNTNVIIPSVAVNSPKITVSAKKPFDQQHAQIAEAVVNHQWRELDVQHQVRQVVKDMIIIGHGWAKVTWQNEVGERELSPEEWQQAVQQAVMQFQQTVANSTLNEDEFPTLDEVIESVPRVVEDVLVDAPAVTRVSPFDMIVDPDAKRLEDARWIAQRSFIPVEVAKKNEDWSPSVRRKLVAKVMSEERDTVGVGEVKEEVREAGFVVVYEWYDLISGEYCVFSDSGDGFLKKPEKSPFPSGHPFVWAENYEVPERLYPLGDLEAIYGLQLELGIARSALASDRQRGKRINMFRAGEIGPDGLDDLESGIDNVMIEVLGDRPFSEVFAPMTSQGLHPEWYNQSEMIISDINMVSAVSEYDRGAIPEGRRTATEAGLIQDAANARSADKLAKVERIMAQIAERMIRLSQAYMEIEDVARVVHDGVLAGYVPYNRDTLSGDFVFEVEAGSTQPKNESFRRQSAVQLMEALSPLMGSGLINDQALIEHVLRNGFGVKDTEKFMGPGPMPPPGPEQGMPPQGAPGGPAPF